MRNHCLLLIASLILLAVSCSQDATQTPTQTESPPPRNSPAATSLPTVTTTHTPLPTFTPTSEPLPTPRLANIVEFDATAVWNEAKKGYDVNLNWIVEHAEKVLLRVGPFGWDTSPETLVDPMGNTTIFYETYGSKNLEITIRASDEPREMGMSKTISLPCNHAYFFEPSAYTPANCPAGNAEKHDVIYVEFENGFAIWTDLGSQHAAPYYVLGYKYSDQQKDQGVYSVLLPGGGRLTDTSQLYEKVSGFFDDVAENPTLGMGPMLTTPTAMVLQRQFSYSDFLNRPYQFIELANGNVIEVCMSQRSSHCGIWKVIEKAHSGE